ncbi:PR-1-like protein [Mycena indigotica]|uniref:PR-1-like protein n=1 Tax=Mycena indigotica TaxID=2126181 RepID=A0A8H6SPY6_9AGAR|nr:PR-1-like protein [Mycena indigotica]KAF7303381.1 PR-1-like protein [Mycena indigotica]
MAGPRPRSLPLLAVLLAAALLLLPPCSPTATTRAPTTAASAPATAAPPPPAKGRPTPNHPAAAPPPPPPPPPPAPTSTSSTAPVRAARPRSPWAINARGGRRAARLRSGPGAVPQVPQRHPRQPQGRPPSRGTTRSPPRPRRSRTRGVFEHSGGKVGPFGREPRGGHGRKYGIEKAIVSWTNEVGDYDPKNPVPSHFTQVVWRGTTQVGCALTVCAPGTIFDPKFTNTAEYYVCEYAPPGQHHRPVRMVSV